MTGVTVLPRLPWLHIPEGAGLLSEMDQITTGSDFRPNCLVCHTGTDSLTASSSKDLCSFTAAAEAPAIGENALHRPRDSHAIAVTKREVRAGFKTSARFSSEGKLQFLKCTSACWPAKMNAERFQERAGGKNTTQLREKLMRGIFLPADSTAGERSEGNKEVQVSLIGADSSQPQGAFDVMSHHLSK